MKTEKAIKLQNQVTTALRKDKQERVWIYNGLSPRELVLQSYSQSHSVSIIRRVSCCTTEQ